MLDFKVLWKDAVFSLWLASIYLAVCDFKIVFVFGLWDFAEKGARLDNNEWPQEKHATLLNHLFDGSFCHFMQAGRQAGKCIFPPLTRFKH